MQGIAFERCCHGDPNVPENLPMRACSVTVFSFEESWVRRSRMI